MKSHQLNWAIQQLSTAFEKSDAESQRTYFGIYDVDSRPELEAIEAVLHGEEVIYQQPSIYLENYKRIGLFQKAGALLQTKWELCRNVAVLHDNYCHYQQTGRLTSLHACTGHGLFLRSDLLLRSDLFHQRGPFDTETLTEDLELGYRLAFKQVPMALLKAVDFTEYAPDPLATIPQTSRWFSGEIHLYHYYKKAPKSVFLTLLVLRRYYLTFKWAFGAPLLFFALLILTVRHPVSLVLAFLSLYLYIYEPFRMLYSFPRWRAALGSASNFYVLVLLGSLRPLFNSLGPFHYFLTTLLNLLLREPPSFVKTPKN
jgi:hypothetical protein